MADGGQLSPAISLVPQVFPIPSIQLPVPPLQPEY